MIKDAHRLDTDSVVEDLQTNSTTGLSLQEVNRRKEKYGLNQLPQPPKKSPFKIFLSQFNDLLIFILILAAIISLVLAVIESEGNFDLEYFFDAVVIVVVLIINALLGFYQEFKAENAVRALQEMSTTNALVLRNGNYQSIQSKDLVPGDVVTIQTGDKIPADIRLIETTNLKINESALTGESLSVEKKAGKVFSQDVPLGDRVNMSYMGTIAEFGKARGIVVSTGSATEVGKISSMVSSIDDFHTPLQKKLEEFSLVLAKVILSISVIMIVLGVSVEYFHNPSAFNFTEAVLGLTIVGVSLAVAAIPEGLPIILTFTLAVSVQRLAKQNSIIRKIHAVETLGSTTFIATDKTGTLTLNELSLDQIVTPTTRLNLRQGFDNIGEINHLGWLIKELSRTVPDSTEGELLIDPLDKSIKNASKKLNVELNSELVEEFPFDSGRKMMSVLSRTETNYTLSVKGAPDVLLEKSSYLLQGDQVLEMNDELKQQMVGELESLAEGGYRVIALAYRELPEIDEISYNLEEDLIFVGYLAFIDPPRPEVREALATCHSAGIRVVMITGDHPKTALSIAKDLNITGKDGQVVTGIEIDQLTDEELITKLENVSVYARVTPEHKLRLVNLLQDQSHIVAMTGDGVNDTPALVKADVGIAMGIAGTDAAKDSADVILMDDNFVTVSQSVEEGRLIKDNIAKFTNYLLASNSSEVLLLFFGFLILAWVAPGSIRELIPISETQILYLNLVTDSFLALALGLEKKESNLMQKPPKDPKKSIITEDIAIRIIFIGLLLSIVATVRFYFLLGPTENWTNLSHERVSYVQSYILTLLVIMEVFVALSYRSDRPIKEIGYFSNRFFTLSVVAVLLGQISILYVPTLNILFDTQPLKAIEWVTILMSSLVIFFILEYSKQWDLLDPNVHNDPSKSSISSTS